MTKLEQFIADEKARIDLAESVTLPAANMKRYLALIERQKTALEEYVGKEPQSAARRMWAEPAIKAFADCERIVGG